MKKKKKLKKIITKMIDKALGKGTREAYLESNPHGFSSVTKTHKSKKKYNRKKKHKNQ